MEINIVTPESVGISASYLNEIEATMQTFVDQNNVAGITTLIARYGKVAHYECYGKLDLALNKPIQTDSLFRIYSLTKPITAVAALILHEEGQCGNRHRRRYRWLEALAQGSGGLRRSCGRRDGRMDCLDLPGVYFLVLQASLCHRRPGDKGQGKSKFKSKRR